MCPFLWKSRISTVKSCISDCRCHARYLLWYDPWMESLKARRWYRRYNCMFKIMKQDSPSYLINLIPKCNQTIRTRNSHIPIFRYRADCFKYYFFPSTLNDWFNLDIDIRSSESISIFKSRLLSLIRPVQKSVFNIFDPKGLILLTLLHLGFSHLNEHRFQ